MRTVIFFVMTFIKEDMRASNGGLIAKSHLKKNKNMCVVQALVSKEATVFIHRSSKRCRETSTAF